MTIAGECHNEVIFVICEYISFNRMTILLQDTLGLGNRKYGEQWCFYRQDKKIFCQAILFRKKCK